mmetsp:Transcript_24555/g.56782  ORF Transcript_24555/g.56782 Transcript_24555/m.56782 type:complete len:201 (-) Transcript_24555:382-984(-)
MGLDGGRVQAAVGRAPGVGFVRPGAFHVHDEARVPVEVLATARVQVEAGQGHGVASGRFEGGARSVVHAQAVGLNAAPAGTGATLASSAVASGGGGPAAEAVRAGLASAPASWVLEMAEPPDHFQSSAGVPRRAGSPGWEALVDNLGCPAGYPHENSEVDYLMLEPQSGGRQTLEHSAALGRKSLCPQQHARCPLVCSLP